MHDASLSRKIGAPALPQIMLHRQAQVRRLQEAIVSEPRRDGNDHHYKLVLCCAPAGYGKTTLLADFARSTSIACCWYFLARVDTDPVVFLQTLLASMRRVFPSFGQHLDLVFGNLFSQQSPSTSGACLSALDALCAALATEISEPFVLFLCNYEEINESERLTELVNALLKQLPSQATLVIESRVMPDLAFAQLLVRDEMGGLDRAALRFSAKDIAELARLHGLTTLSDEEAEQLATSFDGWITGILLGTRLADMRFLLPEKLSADKEGPSLPRGESSALPLRENLVAYLANEVFGRDPVISTFLQDASILQEMEPGMCNALLERTDAAERLAHLERHGLFVTSHQSASHVVYTCHPVVRDLLSEQLRQADPARFCALHRRAAELWRAGKQYEQATYHAGQAGAVDLQVQVLLEASRQILFLELHWLPALLPVVEQHPHLASLRNLLGLEEPCRSQLQNNQPSSRLALSEPGSARLTILAFGEPAVLLDEQPITHWRMAHAMELFFFLLDRDQPTSKESILTALWPEFDEQTNQTFHSTLHHLRKLLGEACIVFRAGGYRLDLAACYGEQVFYDVKTFQAYRLEAEQALVWQDEASARAALLKMVALYRGDYGRPFYNDWCTLRRDELRTAYLDARHHLAELAWQAEAWDESAQHWRHMLLLDNCLEEAHSGLIRCYLRQGKRGAALRQYQSCQKILQQELGIHPGPTLQHLYERLTAK